MQCDVKVVGMEVVSQDQGLVVNVAIRISVSLGRSVLPVVNSKVVIRYPKSVIEDDMTRDPSSPSLNV